VDREINVNYLNDVYKKYVGQDGWGDKGTVHSYIEIYEQHMNKKENISLLEIGIQKGHSIAMWQDYFINSKIYGIDIYLENIMFKNLHNIYKCNGTHKEEVEKIFKNNKFTYVIDDGSHLLEDQIKSFEIFWEKLDVGGKYFIEDVNGDYALEELKKYFNFLNLEYKVIDNRKLKDRYDDIMIILEKHV
jgi:hypothetical protein